MLESENTVSKLTVNSRFIRQKIDEAKKELIQLQNNISFLCPCGRE